MDSSTRKWTAPVKSGEVFFSGAIISIDNNGLWVRGGQTNKIPFIAFQDHNSPDVKAAGSLEGLYIGDNYDVHTSYFKPDEVYARDTPLTWDGTTGNVKPTTLKSGEAIIGYANGPAFSVRAPLTSSVGGQGEVDTIEVNVLRYRTAYLPNLVDNT